ncbi:MAG: thiamine pyrophosphate-dependent dehydrogenase E1 component subunit alpha [Caldilineaceae bacterium]|nr:thiamine pyrophosphate-dependent dehydrogenase E1 component subunit alpha [Caldilineaceae bacterium]
MAHYELTLDQKIEVYYWMRLTRTLDDMAVALWKQGRGVGGMFSQRGHEAISVGTGYALAPEDVVAPLHRDLGCYLLRGMTPRRILSNLLARETGFSRGRDANMHGAGDLSLNIVGFISHLPQSVPVALGVAMSFLYRQEPRVCLTYIGDGSTSAGLFHEVMNMASLYNAPYVLVVENNQYAYSTPLSQQMKIPDIVRRADGYGVPGVMVDGNDVEAVYRVAKEAVERARSGGGPTLIEAKTMRMMGHAIHDGAEYVPRELLAEWEKRNPVLCFEQKLLDEGVLDQAEVDEIKHRCQVEIQDAIDFAESAPWPDPATVEEGVYAP